MEQVPSFNVSKTLIDPIALSQKTESLVMQGNKRKYFRFGTTPDYKTGIATAYAAGCNLRCVFCGAHETRDDPGLAKDFYAPEDVFRILSDIIATKPRIDKMRITDGEPTIGFRHLLELIELVEKSGNNLFVLETNGLLLGNEPDYIKELSRFKKLFVRVSLKAGTPEGFSTKTGMIPEAFDLPFEAIRKLREHRIDFGVSAMSADPRFMDPLERISLITRLGEIDPALVMRMQEEMTILFPTALKRLKAHKWKIKHDNLPFFVKGPLQKYLQISYQPMTSLSKRKISWRHTLKNILQLRHGI